MPALLSFLWSAPYIQKGIETESWEKVRALLADMMCRGISWSTESQVGITQSQKIV